MSVLLLLFSCWIMSDSFVTSWTVALQVLLSMGFPRQECWSRLPFLSPGDLPNPGIEPMPPALQTDSLPLSQQGSPFECIIQHCWLQMQCCTAELWNSFILHCWNFFCSNSSFPPPSSPTILLFGSMNLTLFFNLCIFNWKIVVLKFCGGFWFTLCKWIYAFAFLWLAYFT